MRTEPPRGLATGEIALLEAIVAHCPPDVTKAVVEQARSAVITGGLPTFLEISVSTSCHAVIPQGDGPLPVRGFVPDGEILVWVTDGRLSAIEYAWWSDAAPDGLPDLNELRFGEDATARSDLDGARPLRRLVGFTIDFVVLTVAYRVVILPVCGGDRVLAVSPWLALAFVYFAVPVLVWSKTLGDWICRMRVVAVDQRLGFGRSSLRAAVTIAVIVTLNSYPVPIIELAVVALLGLGVWRTPARRTLLELASGTTVING